MADPTPQQSLNQSPFVPPAVPGQPPQPTLGSVIQPQQSVGVPGAPPQNPQDLAAKTAGWDSFFANPAVATALLQFGVNLLQPRPQGQSVTGAVGSAAGAAGEAVGRVQKQQFEQDVITGREAREQERVGIESRRAASDERRAATDEQRAKDEVVWRKRWNDIQEMQVKVSAMNAGVAAAGNRIAAERLELEKKTAGERTQLERDKLGLLEKDAQLARDRLEHDKNALEKEVKLKTDKLAQDWLLKNSEQSDRNDTNLLSRMIDSANKQPRLPGEPAPDIGKIGNDFLTLRETLKSVKGANGDVFQLGTEQQWRQMLSDPALKAQAIEAFGQDIISKAEKKIQEIDAGKAR